MEQAWSESTLFLSYLLIDLVGFLIFCPVLNWVDRIQKHHSRCLSFLGPQLELFTSASTIQQDDTQSATSASWSKNELRISREEIEMVMERMGISLLPCDGHLKEGVREDDLRGMFEDKEPSLEEVKETFNVFDENGDGFVDAGELQRVLSKLGFREGSTLEECRRMIANCDENSDGKIDFNEFVKFMESSFC